MEPESDESDILEFPEPDGPGMCIIEDDGRVVIAYLMADGEIVSDVWLWNVAPTPAKPQWDKDNPGLPPLNPREFVTAESLSAKCDLDDVTVSWHAIPGESRPGVQIYLGDVLHATLNHTRFSGRCRFASRRGPMASPLPDPS